MDWAVTIITSMLVLIVFAFANWRGRQPAQPLKVRMINYHVVQMACIVVMLVMAAHMLTIYARAPGDRTSERTVLLKAISEIPATVVAVQLVQLPLMNAIKLNMFCVEPRVR